MSHNINITRIKTIYNALEDLQNKVVFVGGATVSLYADRETLELRPTDDVDVIIEILNYKERAQLEDKLREKGFTHDVESGIVCRYKIKGIIVDIMPTNDPSIGFENRWYDAGFQNAAYYTIDDHHTVRILTAAFFLATKWEAFKSRGGNDGRTSRDFEDIVFVFEHRPDIWKEIISGDEALYDYFKSEFTDLRANAHLFEWIDSHVERIEPRATRQILESMDQFLIEEPT